MKKSILFIFGFIIANLLAAQLGINTTNPLAIFHIDGDGKNSATPTVAEQLNDVVITKEGNVGIGTISPLNKLSINTTGSNTGLHLPNGAGSGRVLTSDTQGNGLWASGAIQLQTLVYGTGADITIKNATNDNPHQLMFFTPTENPTIFPPIDKAKDIYGAAYGWNNTEQHYVVPVDGIYRITFQVYFMNVAGQIGSNYRAYLYRNDQQNLVSGVISITDNGNHQTGYTIGLTRLKRGDKIDLRVFSYPTGILSVYGGLGHTFLIIESL